MEPSFIEYRVNGIQYLRLQLPIPTEEAIQAGKFGVCADGTHRPNEEEIRVIVNNQIVGMTNLQIKIENFTRAEAVGRHPLSRHWSKSTNRQAENRILAEKYAHEARVKFLGHANAYSRAFGEEAMRAMVKLVKMLADYELGPPKPVMRQLDLF